MDPELVKLREIVDLVAQDVLYHRPHCRTYQKVMVGGHRIFSKRCTCGVQVLTERFAELQAIRRARSAPYHVRDLCRLRDGRIVMVRLIRPETVEVELAHEAGSTWGFNVPTTDIVETLPEPA